MSELDQLLKEAVDRPLRGWDLSYGGRISTVGPRWDFSAMVVARARRSPDLLDMGTGGGEWLGALPYRPPRTVATEGWAPNVPVARDRLQPLGVEVMPVVGAPDNVDQDGPGKGGELPFPGCSLHLVVNRHGSYLPTEVARILVPGGTFLTQQVGTGQTGPELRRVLTGDEPPPGDRAWTRPSAIRQLQIAGFAIVDSGEGFQTMTFADTGAVVWYLTNVPWEFPDFSAAEFRGALERLHQRIKESGPVTIRQPQFWIEARTQSAPV
jgi:SAM-dependent methyltransferase